MAQTALSSFLKAIYDSSEKNKTKNPKGSVLFFPFLPTDNNLASECRGSFNFKECSLNVPKNNDDVVSTNPNSSSCPFSAIEVENYFEYTVEALRRLLSLPYLTFLR